MLDDDRIEHSLVDGGRTAVLAARMGLPLPVEDVFEFFADAGNLQRITPPELRFVILTPLPLAMAVGARLDYRLTLFGVPFGWGSLIDVWQPPTCFVDRQVRGPYALWEHTHRFATVGDGSSTLVEDEVRYRVRLAPLSNPLRPLVRRELERIFRYRQAAIRRLLTGQPASSPA